MFGGAGSGVLLVRDEKTKKWSEPAFYTIGSASFGLQIGGDVSEMILRGTEPEGGGRVSSTDFKLGADASMALGPVGEGGPRKGSRRTSSPMPKRKGPLPEWQWMAPSSRCRMIDGGLSRQTRETDGHHRQAERQHPKSADLRNAAAKSMQTDVRMSAWRVSGGRRARLLPERRPHAAVCITKTGHF